MDDRLLHEVTAALDADPRLAPYLSELLADLQELGSSADVVCDLLAPLNLPAAARVLDLGCGKGPIAIALALRFGFRAVGVDGFAPFIEDARTSAAQIGVGDLCDFRLGDLRDALASKDIFDVVVLAALGRILGDVRETAGQLRRVVRPGGYIVVDDGYLVAGHHVENGNYAGYLPHVETIAAMEAFGDKVVREIPCSAEDMREENEENTRLIRQRAEALAKKYPQDAEALRAFVARQEAECKILENDLIAATWLIRRGP